MHDSVMALVEAGVSVDGMGAGGNTALHLATHHGQEGVAAVLMQAGEICPGTAVVSVMAVSVSTVSFFFYSCGFDVFVSRKLRFGQFQILTVFS